MVRVEIGNEELNVCFGLRGKGVLCGLLEWFFIVKLFM